MRVDYDETLTLNEARALYFEVNGFGEDGGYNDDWVSGKFGPVPFAFPNTDARKRAVPLHDLHHVITGYATDGAGEGAIAAWELASGCGRHWAAWFLNLNAMLIGSLLYSRTVWTAFLHGRASRNYYIRGIDDELLATELAVARSELLGTEAQPPATAGDCAAFAGWWSVGLLLAVAQLSLVFGPLAWLASWLFA